METFHGDYSNSQTVNNKQILVILFMSKAAYEDDVARQTQKADLYSHQNQPGNPRQCLHTACPEPGLRLSCDLGCRDIALPPCSSWSSGSSPRPPHTPGTLA